MSWRAPAWASSISQLYAVLVLALVAGSLLLRGEGLYRTGYTLHSIMGAVATVLAFIIGALALVRYYSRKQATFLLIGCGFLGAALLDLNHAFETTPRILDVKVLMDSGLGGPRRSVPACVDGRRTIPGATGVPGVRSRSPEAPPSLRGLESTLSRLDACRDGAGGVSHASREAGGPERAGVASGRTRGGARHAA